MRREKGIDVWESEVVELKKNHGEEPTAKLKASSRLSRCKRARAKVCHMDLVGRAVAATFRGNARRVMAAAVA